MIASHVEIATALTELVPGASWHLQGDSFDSVVGSALEWLDETQLRPSDEQIFSTVEEIRTRSI